MTQEVIMILQKVMKMLQEVVKMLQEVEEYHLGSKFCRFPRSRTCSYTLSLQSRPSCHRRWHSGGRRHKHLPQLQHLQTYRERESGRTNKRDTLM